jgi:LPS-assembly protein
MKNKNYFLKILFFFILFFQFSFVLSDEFQFEAATIETSSKGDIINGFGGVEINYKKDLTLTGEVFQYNKPDTLLSVEKNVLIKDKFNKNSIESKKITFNKKLNIIYIPGKAFIEIDGGYSIESSNITYDKNLNLIFSNNKTLVTDLYTNKYYMNAFSYSVIDQILIADNVKITDTENNIYEIKNIRYNLKTNEIIGKDISLVFNSEIQKSNQNEPRLKGNAIFYKHGTTQINKGVFTTCKKDDSCPPWVLKAEKIEHDKVEKIINYKNAFLELYDVPVFYFPRFFHPDPSVKRQSGFLNPSFSQSNNLGNYISIPYFNAISKSSDLTFSPRFYDDGKSIYQSEYRKINKKSEHALDFGIKNKSALIFDNNKNDTATHFFSRSIFDIDLNDAFIGTIALKIQQTSDDEYLKTYKLMSPLIESHSTLNSKLDFDLYSEDLQFEFVAETYENLSLQDSDRFEYIYPSINILKSFDNFKNGNLNISSSVLNKEFQTNKKESTVVNDLSFKSYNKISSIGLLTSYEFLIKNFNSDSNNSVNYSDKNSSSIEAITKYQIKYPLKKNRPTYTSTITPLISATYSPNDTKNKSQDDRIINFDNIFSINRIGVSDTVEGGQSITVGTEYSLYNNKADKKYFSANLATLFRDKENKNLPTNSTLGEKKSDVFGNINFNGNQFIDLDYEFALDNDLKTINLNKITSTLSFYKFVSEFNFLEKKGLQSQSYITNETKLSINDSSYVGFRTRRNKETNVTEYYNLLYEYQNDCLTAGIEFKKNYYNDNSLKPEELLFFSITIMPFGKISTPGLNK